MVISKGGQRLKTLVSFVYRLSSQGEEELCYACQTAIGDGFSTKVKYTFQ